MPDPDAPVCDEHLKSWGNSRLPGPAKLAEARDELVARDVQSPKKGTGGAQFATGFAHRHFLQSVPKALFLIFAAGLIQANWHQVLIRREASLDKRYFTQGEILFAEGDAGGVAYVIKKGRVSLTKRTSNGMSKSVATIEAGSIVGEMSLIKSMPHSVTATATDDGEALILTREEYKARLDKSDKVLAMILRSLSDRLRSTY